MDFGDSRQEAGSEGSKGDLGGSGTSKAKYISDFGEFRYGKHEKPRFRIGGNKLIMSRNKMYLNFGNIFCFEKLDFTQFSWILEVSRQEVRSGAQKVFLGRVGYLQGKVYFRFR